MTDNFRYEDDLYDILDTRTDMNFLRNLESQVLDNKGKLINRLCFISDDQVMVAYDFRCSKKLVFLNMKPFLHQRQADQGWARFGR